MSAISLCMIVKNEAAVMGRCLDSVRGVVDEIIIVDTGSDDSTRAVASLYTDKLYGCEWTDDFAAARNYSFSLASCDYILWLDADDVLPAESAEALLALKSALDGIDAVYMRYDTLGADGTVALTHFRERLVRRACGFKWVGAVHEYLDLSGNVVTADICIRHHHINRGSDRNLRIYEKMLADGKLFAPRDTYYYGRELFEHNRFSDADAVLTGFLALPDGWSADKQAACRLISSCRSFCGKPQEAVAALLEAFSYAPPSAGIFCALGELFLSRERWRLAAFFFASALTVEPGEGFVCPDEQGFIPLISLCVCHDRLGEYPKAWEYNERAAALKPTHPSVLSNRAYLSAKIPLA